MLGVTLDTNVYVSGLNYRGSPYRLLELARDGRVLVIVSDQILDEVEWILHEKFQWPKHRARQARRDIRDFAEHVTPDERLDIVKEDPDDKSILECAVERWSDYLILGDKDLLRL